MLILDSECSVKYIGFHRMCVFIYFSSPRIHDNIDNIIAPDLQFAFTLFDSVLNYAIKEYFLIIFELRNKDFDN